jgi:hypothetical protein
VDLWVDDERSAPKGWCWVQTNTAAIDILRTHRVAHVSLDYVLKRGETTDEIMYWLRGHPERWPTGSIVCHSGSADAQALIEKMAKDFSPTAG